MKKTYFGDLDISLRLVETKRIHQLLEKSDLPFFWAAHNFGQVKWTQSWSREAASSTLLTQRMAISRKRKELLQISGCKTTGFLRAFQISKKNRIFELLDDQISGFLYFFGFLVVSRERKELLEIRGCQNDQIFQGFSNFPKDIEFLDFWMTGFLYFSIVLGYLSVSSERKELLEIRGCQNDQICNGFSNFQNIEFLDDWISVFIYFCISVFTQTK